MGILWADDPHKGSGTVSVNGMPGGTLYYHSCQCGSGETVMDIDPKEQVLRERLQMIFGELREINRRGERLLNEADDIIDTLLPLRDR
jgi:hypothetical protein